MPLPLHGEEFTFKQPDGTSIKVRGWGSQYNAVFETLDGFSVVKDPITGFYQYGLVTEDGEAMKPMGIRPGAGDPLSFGVKRGARLTGVAASAAAQMGAGLPPGKSRWEVRRERHKRALRAAMMAPGMASAPPKRETVGAYLGLCLLIEFPDVPATISRQEVEDFCNKPGYTGFGNHGSVYDYFSDISGGKLQYKNIVAPYYKAKYPRDYYTNPQIAQPHRAWRLIKEALDDLKAKGFSFDNLTSDKEDYVYALNVFYAGDCVNNWSEGLWPHSYHLLTPYNLAPNKKAFDYQITDMGSELTLGTFCHENGHMICDFPDLYDYGDESHGVGVYCLMCAGGVVDRKNPTDVCAYLKYRAGWASKIVTIKPGLSGQAAAGSNAFYVHAGMNSSEYFIIENRVKAGRDLVLPGSGLAIWHVDETGSNNNEAMTSDSHYECALEQADGAFELEQGVNDGNAADLFYSKSKNAFSAITTPDSNWWNGSPSGLEIKNVGEAGKVVEFQA